MCLGRFILKLSLLKNRVTQFSSSTGDLRNRNLELTSREVRNKSEIKISGKAEVECARLSLLFEIYLFDNSFVMFLTEKKKESKSTFILR